MTTKVKVRGLKTSGRLSAVKKNKQTLRAAIYARSASRGQVGEDSLNEQLFVLNDYCIEKGYVVAETYGDEGQPGVNNERLGLKKMIGDASSKKFDVVIVLKLEKLGRNLRDTLLSVTELEKQNIQLEVVNEPNLDFSTTTAKLLLQYIADLDAHKVDMGDCIKREGGGTRKQKAKK